MSTVVRIKKNYTKTVNLSQFINHLSIKTINNFSPKHSSITVNAFKFWMISIKYVFFLLILGERGEGGAFGSC